MAQKFTNAARAALTAGISSGDTSLTVSAGLADLFPVADTNTDPIPTVGKDWFKVVLQNTSGAIEIVYVRTRALGSPIMSNIQRAREGTTALAFLAGSVVGLRHTALDLEDAVALASSAGATGETILASANQAAAQSAIGLTATGIAVGTAASQAAARTALGASTPGDTVFTGTAAQGRTALGSTPVGDAVFIAADAAAARTTLGAVGLTGNEIIAGTKQFSVQPVLPQAPVLMTAQNTTSGTSIDFTSIPSWVNRITVMLDSISTNGTSALLVQIGAGSVQSSGYASQYWAGGSVFSGAVTVGFGQCSMNGGSNGYIGSCVLTRVSGNKWVANGSINITDAGNLGFCSNGVVSLSGALDRVRLTTVNGTDTFDAGSVNILYE